MAWFEYIAEEAGAQAGGLIEAETAEGARLWLRENGRRAILVRPSAGPPGLPWARLDPSALFPPRPVHIEITLRQLAVLLRSGLTLLASLETLIEQAPSRSVARIWEGIRGRIEAGSGLAQAMAGHRAFGHATLQLAALGEESGNLDEMLGRAARAMEQRRVLAESTLNALAYPAITLAAACGVAGYMVAGVVPQLEKFLKVLGRKLPPMTQSLLDLSAFLGRWALPLGIAAAALAAAAAACHRWPPGRLWMDGAALRLPVVGGVLRTGATALFARSMAILLGSGIPLLDSLRAVQHLHANRFLAALLDRARREIVEGSSLAGALRAPHAYTPMLGKMVAVGEASGTLDEILGHVADFHEENLRAAIKRLAALVEPAIIVFVGGVVGYVYIAFFVALFAATSAH